MVAWQLLSRRMTGMSATHVVGDELRRYREKYYFILSSPYEKTNATVNQITFLSLSLLPSFAASEDCFSPHARACGIAA